MKRYLSLPNLAFFAVGLVLSVGANMLIFGDTFGQALTNPYMWLELVILAGTLIYLSR